ncbi:MAG: winged helix-turn-helix domain-containing protein, partial [Acidobacteriota bacterium]
MNGSTKARRAEATFDLGQWRVEPQLLRVSGHGQVLALEPRVMEVLLALCEQPGEVVSRQHLLDTVWPDTFVGEKALTMAVSKLRRAFQDDPRQPAVIATIPKRGYRLVAPLRPVAARSAPLGELTRRDSPTGRSLLAAVGVATLVGLTAGASLRVGHRLPFAPSPAIALTTEEGHELNAAISDDGREVVYSSTGADGNVDLWLQRVGGSRLRLTRDPATEIRPALSPDGTHLAFVRYTASDCGLWVQPVPAGAARRLAGCSTDAPRRVSWGPKPAWSPDGETLAFPMRSEDSAVAGSAAAGRGTAIHALPVAGGAPRRLTLPPEGFRDFDPSYSPDGTQLAFTRIGHNAAGDLWVVSPNSGKERRLTHELRPIFGHDWTPDGRALVFSSLRSGTFQLWHLDLATNNLSWVPATGTNLKEPSLSTTGRLIYEDWAYEVNLWRLDFDRGVLSPVAASTRRDVHPAISPDGSAVAWVSNRSGAYEIWRARGDGSEAVQLTQLESSMVAAPNWSPDGLQIVFEARIDGRADLYSIPASGGMTQRLTEHPADEVLATYSADGRWLYFASDRRNGWQVWRLPATGGTPIQLTESGGFAPRPSPDGRWLFHARHDAAGIWRMPA